MSSYEKMNQILKQQKEFFIKNGAPSVELRIDRLQRLKTLIMDNRYDFIDALNSDFGNRSKNASMLSDVYGIMPAINLAIKNVKKWSKPEKKSSNFPFGLLGAKSYIKYEPLGTVGMISPWNFPVNLAFVPLVSIFAAGNQVMHKPSEHTPITSQLLKDLCDKSYDENEFATFLGGPEVGESFTKLNFDHLLYTGGGSVAKHVMKLDKRLKKKESTFLVQECRWREAFTRERTLMTTGLYHPDEFRDNCGFGLIAHMKGEASHTLLQTAIESLTCMTHRGGIAADGKTGDGCGLLIQSPEAFLRKASKSAFGKEPGDLFAVGQVFLSQDPAKADATAETDAETTN